MKRTLHAFRTGFFAPVRGLVLALENKRIRRLMVIPCLVTAAAFIFGLTVGIGQLAVALPALTHRMADDGPLYWLLLILLWPVSLFALFYFLFLLGRVAAAPFYCMLAERVLIEQRLLIKRSTEPAVWMQANLNLLRDSLLKLAVFGILGTGLFFLSFLPGLGFFTAFGFLLLAAFDVVDLSFEALQMGFRERFTVFRSEFPAFVGLACALGLVFLVPGLNFFLFPAAIAGSTEIVRLNRTATRAPRD